MMLKSKKNVLQEKRECDTVNRGVVERQSQRIRTTAWSVRMESENLSFMENGYVKTE